VQEGFSQKSEEFFMNKKMELLSPAGSMEKLKYAFAYGADACYLAGKSFGLRANAANFDEVEMKEAVEYAHARGRKIYVTLNIFARNDDFEEIKQYVKFLESIKVDAVIISNPGVMKVVRENTNLEIHVSTQANVVNKYEVEFYAKTIGAKRIILARELTLHDIKGITEHIKKEKLDVEIETFVHGAMCISYSGRCLMSNFIADRPSNLGQCVQPCRFKWEIRPMPPENSDVHEGEDRQWMTLETTENASYIMNSKDMMLIEYIKEMQEAGIAALKIEGRMKTAYYVANVTNAYRRAIDGSSKPKDLKKELLKISNRTYTTGFMFDDKKIRENQKESISKSTHDFSAVVLGKFTPDEFFVKNTKLKKNLYLIEQRTKFEAGDTLEILSPSKAFNKTIKVKKLYNEEGNPVEVANLVQQKLVIESAYQLSEFDILRKIK